MGPALKVDGKAALLNSIRQIETDDSDHRRIRDAAHSAFLRFGIKRTTISEIASRAGTSTATVYRRFPTKSDIVTAVVLQQTHQFINNVKARVASLADHGASAEEQIAELFLSCTNGVRNNELLASLIEIEPETVLPLFTVNAQPIIELGRDYLVEFIRELQHRGLLVDYDPQPIAELVARTSLSFALTRSTQLPLNDDRARAFAQQHIAPVFRPASTRGEL